MTQMTREAMMPSEIRQTRDVVAAEPVAKVKKTYRKPELSKYEQLHGVGLGS